MRKTGALVEKYFHLTDIQYISRPVCTTPQLYTLLRFYVTAKKQEKYKLSIVIVAISSGIQFAINSMLHNFHVIFVLKTPQ